jgi:diguanylate cyclase (GGDEF)-like protein
LKRVASVIGENIKRPSDLTARYGGEEFTVILPGTNVENAAIVAERLREAVLNLNIEHTESPEGIVSISIGVSSTVPLSNELSSGLVEMADKALYQAKSTGRNKVCCADS